MLWGKHVDLLLIGEKGKRQYVLIKDFNRFLYNYTWYLGRKQFCHYCLQDFSTQEILNCHIKDFFKTNGKNKDYNAWKGEYIKFKNYEWKIESPFMIYADFESILMQEDNGRQNPEESYMNKYQKHIAYGYGYKLVCLDYKFSGKPFKTHLGKDTVYNSINNMIEESKYENILTKNFWWLKKKMKILRTLLNVSTKWWIWDNDYVDNDVKGRDHCHITGK